ncbi:condensation domain protein [Catenulispora acidiphila DSM 44928]|uniref:Condensation domain protein n=1 Tax=Catenulispora acidiphila (strain DSM 44928 / JCM 14897 / NBRC 102108 / NRRL B-24433 / ID139908) TaxID=479433 RepID=C7QAJ0_CATAD|nr:condensation domain-containing protein [Catenulispora acidiphila]ACU72489.1 condensation domain protein [Catenulispora acidiphila DSM 44928]
MAVVVSEIAVAFEGAGGGAGELTWGQLGIWRRTQQTGRTMNLVVHMPLEPGVPVAELAGMLRFLVSRHPALRTRLRFVAAPDGGLRPQQVIAEAGKVPLRIVDLDDGDELVAAVEEQRSRYELDFFDYEREFPIRMAVIRQSGTPVHLVIGYSHVLLDGVGIRALAGDLEHFDRAGGEAGVATAPPPEVPSPLDVAQAQGAPSGRRQSSRALRYWAAQLDRLTGWQAAEPAVGEEPRYWELVGYSPAMELGMRAVAARTGVGTTHVLLAAYAVAVSRVFGRDPSLAQIVVGNRFRPGFAELASQISQHGICVVDVADAAFDEVVARAEKAVTGASFAGYYDPVECDALLAQVAAQRGRPLGIEWHLNDRRDNAGAGERDGVVPDARDVDEVLPLSKWYWGRKVPVFDGALFIQVDSEPLVPERRIPGVTPPAVHLEIWIDTRSFAVAQIEAFAREMEAVVVEAARA